jgi:hypothetical protein
VAGDELTVVVRVDNVYIAGRNGFVTTCSQVCDRLGAPVVDVYASIAVRGART